MPTQNDQHSRNLVMMNRRQFLRVAGIGTAATAFLAACAVPAQPGSDSGAAPADAGAAAEAPASGGGTMVWMGHQEVAGLGPDDTGPTVQYVMVMNIHDPLLYTDEFTNTQPVLAESYEVSEDGLTYTFKLHQGVMFHDGTELTAKDVAYTYDYYRNPDNAASIVGDFTGIASVEAADDYTVVVNMESVNAASLSTWAETPIVNSTYHAEVGEDIYRTAPVGSGPYKVKGWSAAEFTELEAFDDYFGGRPTVDIIRQEVVPEPSVRMIALQTGDADSAVWPLLVEDSIILESDPNFVVFRTLANSVKHFPLNNTLPQLSDKMVRKAMMHALDRQRLIDDLWNGAAQIAHSNLAPKNAFYYNNDLPQYEYDVEKAAAMLDEAGWTVGDDGIREKDGVKLSFTCTTITGDQARRPIAELAQQMLIEVGVDMQLAEAPVASILEAMRGGTMDCSLFNWTYGSTPEPDPFSTLHTDGGNNFCRYSNPEMDALIEEGLTIADPEARKAIYYRIQEIFVDEVPALYLQFDEWMNPFSARIMGLPDAPLSGDPIYLRAEDWSLSAS